MPCAQQPHHHQLLQLSPSHPARRHLRAREGARREGCSELGSGDAGLEAARDPTEDDLAGRSPDGALEAQLATDDQWPDAGPPMGSSVAGAVALVRPSRGHGMGVHVAGGRCDVRPASRRLASTLGVLL